MTGKTKRCPRDAMIRVPILCGLLLLAAQPALAAPDAGALVQPDARAAAAPVAQPPPAPAKQPEAKQPPATQPPATGEFQPWDPSKKEQVSAPLFVVIAYSGIWLAVLAFVISVWMRQRRVEQELAELLRDHKESA